jgi:hypothetical protein
VRLTQRAHLFTVVNAMGSRKRREEVQVIGGICDGSLAVDGGETGTAASPARVSAVVQIFCLLPKDLLAPRNLDLSDSRSLHVGPQNPQAGATTLELSQP